MNKILPQIALFTFSVFLLSTIANPVEARTCTQSGLCKANVKVEFMKSGQTTWSETLSNMGADDQFTMRFNIKNDGSVPLPALSYEIKLPQEVTRIGGSAANGSVPELPLCQGNGETDTNCEFNVTLTLKGNASAITMGECTDVLGNYMDTSGLPGYNYSNTDTGQVCFGTTASSTGTTNNNDDSNQTNSSQSQTLAEVPDTGSEQLYYGVFSAILLTSGSFLAYRHLNNLNTAKSKKVKSILERL